MQHVIIIPAFQPDSTLIESLVHELRARGFHRILVVDDGSGASYQELFDKLEQNACRVVHHEVNHGRGAALKTGIRFARELWPEAPGVVCVDANAQHRAADVMHVACLARIHADSLVLGTDTQLGIRPSAARGEQDVAQLCDAHTGLIAIPASRYQTAVDCTPDRFDWTQALIHACADTETPLRSMPVRATRAVARHNERRDWRARLHAVSTSLQLIALFWADASADASVVAPARG